MSQGKFKRILFTESFLKLSSAKKLAYVGVFTALSILVNIFLSIDVTPTQKITFNYFASFFCGAFFGPIIGFVICFLGDLLAFLLPLNGGIYWLPTGICSGLLAFIPGIIFTTVRLKIKGAVYVKTAIAVTLMYLIVTCCLGALANYTYVKFVIYAGREYKTLFTAYLGAKILFSSIVSLINYALVFAVIPLVDLIKNSDLKLE